jgi:O-antigen/teichoic acid export membrane protein
MLINMFFGPVVNAARGIAYQVEGSVTQFGSNFMMAVRPQIYKYYAKGEVEKMMDLVYRSARYSFFLLWILSLPILIESDYILTLWLKNVPEYTTVFARIVLIISLISALRNPFIAAMHATGKIKLANLICGSLLIMTLPISYLYLRLGFGPSSVFLVSLLITFVNMWVELMLVKRVVHFSIKEVILKVLLVSLLVALVSCLIPWSIQYRLAPGFYRFFLVGLASVLSVFAAVYLIGIDAKERVFIGNRIKSFMPL